MEISTKSDKDTKAVGEILARSLMEDGPRKVATLVSLEGDLGAGKTTFVQGFAKGLGIKEIPKSPTFVLMKIFRIPGKKGRKHFENLIHMDVYRISARDLNALEWSDFSKNPANLILVEWGGRIKKAFSKKVLRVIFEHGKNEKERILRIQE